MSEQLGALMGAEIAAQGAVWSAIADSPDVQRAASFIARAAPEVIVLAGRGTSDHAAIYGQYLIQAALGIPAYLATPALATVFGGAPFPRGALLVALSQSGASPDLLATVAAARAQGVPTLSITNSPGSPLANAADEHLDLGAGLELSVAATKSYTAELVALFGVVHRLLGTRDAGRSSITELVNSFTVGLASLEDHGDAIARTMFAADRALIIGRGFSYSTAKEGALKLMETSAIAASGWSAADAKHGPLGQLSESAAVVLLAASPSGRSSVLDLLASIESRTSMIDIIAPHDERFGRSSLIHPVIPSTLLDSLIPVLEIVPLQFAALALSRARGLDADNPRGLSKVTLTT